MGSFSKIIFDGLFTRSGSNMLPAIREGYSTLSNLILTGRPHFMCSRGDWDVGYRKMNSILKHTLKRFYKNFCQGGSSWKAEPELYKEFGILINQARSPSSPFSRYFADLANDASILDNDRVHYVLAKSMQFLRGNRTAFAEAQAYALPPAPFKDRDDERSNRI